MIGEISDCAHIDVGTYCLVMILPLGLVVSAAFWVRRRPIYPNVQMKWRSRYQEHLWFYENLNSGGKLMHSTNLMTTYSSPCADSLQIQSWLTYCSRSPLRAQTKFTSPQL